MKQIENAPNYFVTEEGEIYNKSGNKKAQYINRDGYMTVELFVKGDGKPTKYAVHRFVAKAFIPNPENKPCVNHIDGNKTNNHVTNLEWCTYSENTKHAIATGLVKTKNGEAVGNSLLSDAQVHEICKMMEEGYRNIDIHETLGIEKHLLKNIRRGSSWSFISKNYSIPKKSRTLSEETIHWICSKIEAGMSNRDILALSTNEKVTKSIITKIKNRKQYTDISAQYNF